MADKTPGTKWLSIVALITMAVALVGLGVAFSMRLAELVVDASAGARVETLLRHGLFLGACTAAGLAAVVAYGLVNCIAGCQKGVRDVDDHVNRLESILQALYESNRRLVDLAQMSDAAKSLLFRQREIEAMSELLHDELMAQDYDKAEALVSDIQKRLGYEDQVLRMRKEISVARSTTMEQKIDSAIDRVKKYLDAHEWSVARRIAERLEKLLPENPRIQALPEMIREAQASQKRDLLHAYGEAVKRGDVDRSIELLRELDKYLTPQEAAALEESARGVFRAKLHNLGVQFAIRVTEEQWADALAIGQQIIGEYPNSRMAQEVRTKIDTLQVLSKPKAG